MKCAQNDGKLDLSGAQTLPKCVHVFLTVLVGAAVVVVVKGFSNT